MTNSKTRLLITVLGVGFVAAVLARRVGASSQETVPQTGDRNETKPADATPPATGESAGGEVKPADDWEKRLADALTGSVLEGTWQMNRKGDDGKFGPLTEPKPDRYNISKAVKLFGERWLITARIGYGEKDVYVPVPVRIVLVDGTPVITLDKLDIPGIGRYSSRVVIDGQYYAGTWTGDGYGGILSGRIAKPDAGTNDPENAGLDRKSSDEKK
ncbi:MAG: hypothetical protein HOP29_08960 [Phycisphaerales bacterium]|nr:hypothetical protein [Phycisphaerales bacterium]